MKYKVVYKQLNQMDCGPTCLKIIAKYYGKPFTSEYLARYISASSRGVSMLELKQAAEAMGFESSCLMLSFDELLRINSFPCIAHWNKNHFVVVYEVKKCWNSQRKITIADPQLGIIQLSENEFLQRWASSNGKSSGIILLLNPTQEFYEKSVKKENPHLRILLQYMAPYRRSLLQIFICMLLVSVFQILVPFLTQLIVDQGIYFKQRCVVLIIIIAELLLLLSILMFELIKNWITLYVASRINLSLISDYLIRLMNLSISYFETKKIADFIQRISDHSRIERFLTQESIGVIFSMGNFLVFCFILGVQRLDLLLIILAGNLCYIIIASHLIRKRKQLDSKRFIQSSEEQNTLIQLLSGIQDIKLNSCEKEKRWKWERAHVSLFHVRVQALRINQYQRISSLLFGQITNLFISYLLYTEVISEDISLGKMMSLSYIVGQLIAPIEQFIGFYQSCQDAMLSTERLNELHNTPNESDEDLRKLPVPTNASIILRAVSFSYNIRSEKTIKNISITIPYGKVTAIVGASGGGKTTLLKILLGIYTPTDGCVFIGETPLKSISEKEWRQNTGAVLQDGYIFSDTILGNITMKENSDIDEERFEHAISTANLREFIDSLPLGYNTSIGVDGNGISQGQKQRILIARTIYKNPNYIFLDEATNALDANNESSIGEKLKEFYKGKTVIIVAHRLSTIQKADQILVLNHGKIVEVGTHSELINNRADYYKLVKEQIYYEL